MISNYDELFSDNIMSMKRSPIRELLKLIANPEIISFAGGLPAPETFPKVELKKIVSDMMENEADLALQYGATEGDTLLRKCLVERYRTQGFDIGVENLIITTASQQALDLVAKIFINKGDKVIVELPSYLGGLSAFNSYRADMIGIPMDTDGIKTDLLEEKLKELKAQGIKPKFIYTIPDFQNPAGISMSLERRLKVIELAKEYQVLIVEDTPYRELRFDGEHIPPIYALDKEGLVINLGTFSKIFAPGLRIGWVIANTHIIDKIVVAKQATDLCTSPFTQRVAARYMETGIMDTKIQEIIKLYRTRRDLMLKTMDEYLPKEVTYATPHGGLFLFLSCPERIKTTELLKLAIEEKVAYVSGESFFCDGTGTNTMRINFSYASEEQIVEGIKRLSHVIQMALNK